MILTLDTETTGLPKDWKASMKQVDNWPRIIQIAWSVSDREGNLLEEFECLIKPDGWNVPDYEYWIGQGYDDATAKLKGKFWIENGFTQKENMEKGRPMADVIDELILVMIRCYIMVCHNVPYDYNVLGAEFIRYGKSSNKRMITMCTQEHGTDFCKIPGMYGKYKWPKLIELYRKLFKKDFDGAHQANSDVTAARECFHELVRLGVIKMP